MRIKVTEQHIKDGRKYCSTACPVALAVKDATGLPAQTYAHIFLFKKGTRPEHFSTITTEHQQPTPDGVFDKIKYYDNFGQMEPFEFEIDYENQSN